MKKIVLTQKKDGMILALDSQKDIWFKHTAGSGDYELLLNVFQDSPAVEKNLVMAVIGNVPGIVTYGDFPINKKILNYVFSDDELDFIVDFIVSFHNLEMVDLNINFN